MNNLASCEAPKQVSQTDQAFAHLEAAVSEATDLFGKLQARLEPVCRTTAKPLSNEPKPKSQWVPLAEHIESLACKVDSLIQRMQDTHEGLEL